MKKLVFTFFAISMAISAFSQTVSFGVKGGLNMAIQSLSGTSAFAQLKNEYLPGKNIGILFDIGFKDFSIQPNISYTEKGETLPIQEYPAGGVTYPIALNNAKFEYAEESVNLLFHKSVAKNLSFQLGGGFYYAEGISVSITSGSETEPASFDNSPAFAYNYKNNDFGINVISGIIISNVFLIDLRYTAGLTNISNNVFPADKIENRVFSISIGYLFK